MWLVKYVADNEVNYTGPFPNEDRAKRYIQAIMSEIDPLSEPEIIPLITPYSVVKAITWRTEY